MRLILFLLFIIAAYSKEITIATYNVENLFDTKQSGREYPQYSKNYSNWGFESYREKLKNISSVIGSLSPNIIALQEVESEKALVDLKKQCIKKGTPLKHHVFGGTHSKSNTCVALLSQYPITNSRIHQFYLTPKKRRRNVLEATVNTPLGDLRLIVVHFPSKRHKEEQRAKAAAVVSSIIDTLPSGCEYLVLGDFNSNFDEAARSLTEKLDNNGGICGINHLLNTTPSEVGEPFRLYSASEVSSDKKNALYNPWLEKEGFHQYSYRYRGDLTTIDHILIPASLLDNKGITYKSNSFSHFTMNSVLTKDLTPFRWQTQKREGNTIHLKKGYSDHLPISLILTNIYTQQYKEVSNKHGSFENCNDGWIIMSPHFYGIRSNKQALEGKYSFNINGKGKRNGAMASCIAIIPPNQKTASISIGGNGEYAIRLKNLKSDSWLYLVNDELQKSGSQSYTVHPTKKWVQREIPLYPFNAGDTINIEIRYRGNVQQNLFIDNCSLNGWFRSQEK